MSRGGSSISPQNTMPRIEITSASDHPMPAVAAATNNRKSSCVSVDRFDVRKDNEGLHFLTVFLLGINTNSSTTPEPLFSESVR